MTRFERDVVLMLVLSAWSWITAWTWAIDTLVLTGMVFVSAVLDVAWAYVLRDVRKPVGR